MNKLAYHDNPLIVQTPRKGANVYGLPMSKELASYLDDAVPDSDHKRMFNMFFAGRVGGTIQMIEAASEEDF